MSEILEARALLSLLVDENQSTHKECIRALSWLQDPAQPSTVRTDSDIDEKRSRTAASRFEREAEPRDCVSGPIAEELDTWLNKRAHPTSNWFVMKGASFDILIEAFEKVVHVTVNQVLTAHPGAYELGGLWRIRPGVAVNLVFPANFDPDHQCATVVLKVSYKNVLKLFQLPVSSLIKALESLLRKIIEGNEPQ